jgi:hypothetical protein
MSTRFLTLAYWLAQAAFWLSLAFWIVRKDGAWIAAVLSSAACIGLWAIRRSYAQPPKERDSDA